VERGTFAELVAANGEFADLARSQFLMPGDRPDQVKIRHKPGKS
jgi:hypothetical protein